LRYWITGIIYISWIIIGVSTIMITDICSVYAVCSKTLWIGHLNRHTREQELLSELSQFGEVSSVNVSCVIVLLCYCWWGVDECAAHGGHGAVHLGPYLSLPYLQGGQVVTPAQRWGRISSAQCAAPM